MEEDKPRDASRCTILFDDVLYEAVKSKAVIKRLKLYEYLNNLIAKDLGRAPLYLSKPEKKKGMAPTSGLKHPTTRKALSSGNSV